MSAVLSVQRFGNPAGQPAIFSKMEMHLSPFLDATFWNYCLQKTEMLQDALVLCISLQ